MSWVSINEACAQLGLGYQTTLNAILKGTIKGRQPDGRRWEVESTSIERYREMLFAISQIEKKFNIRVQIRGNS